MVQLPVYHRHLNKSETFSTVMADLQNNFNSLQSIIQIEPEELQISTADRIAAVSGVEVLRRKAGMFE